MENLSLYHHVMLLLIPDNSPREVTSVWTYIVSPAFFWLALVWSIFLHPLLLPYLCLYMHNRFFVNNIELHLFYPLWYSLSLNWYRPFPFKVITDVIGLISTIVVTVFYLLLLFFVAFLLLFTTFFFFFLFLFLVLTEHFLWRDFTSSLSISTVLFLVVVLKF